MSETSGEVRFQFGQNWKDYSRTVDDEKLRAAIAGLIRLIPDSLDPSGKSFLDIGSGSGLHSVAASRLGFGSITATDYDRNSVEATRLNASRFGAAITSLQDDILKTKLTGHFDVVYSWGVLHHTGDMKKAVRTAAALVRPGGHLILALYRKSPMCGTWRGIKHAYCISPAPIKKVAEIGFFGVMAAAHRIAGKGSGDYADRGMNLYHDAVDWLGGYPYESAAPEDIDELVGPGLSRIQEFNTRPAPIRGVLGTGCAEYVLARTPPKTTFPL
ncbi:class I SAM-dependent methyltransferase [Hyphomicrobium sulfonivorans]|uniref:class I SAM-dependent methyltransferase n=1 Tax=Hyphomicrobium sulfonivorans TaxID=121290 RepID=UPI00156F427D|nr:class I SAM-dependent methyltransferase [Hyphomicrobium sulfonivorans]MBI1649854.1 class I SAM-dependent methyltransferase [Hyphomicrobium sulfonivorans]